MSIKCDGAVHVDSQALSFEPCDLAPKAVQHESSSTSPRVPNLANLDSVVFLFPSLQCSDTVGWATGRASSL